MLVSVHENVATIVAPVVAPPELDPAALVESAAPELPELPELSTPVVPADVDAPEDPPPPVDVEAPPPVEPPELEPPELAPLVEPLPVLEPLAPPSSPQARANTDTAIHRVRWCMSAT